MCFIHFIRFIRFIQAFVSLVSFIAFIHFIRRAWFLARQPAATLAARRPAGWLSTTLPCVVGGWLSLGFSLPPRWLAGWLGLWPAGGPGKTDHHRDKGAQPTRPRTAGGRSVLKDLGRSQAKTDHQRENSCRNLCPRIWAPEARSTQGDPFRRIWVAQRPQGATLNNNNAADVRFEGFRPLGSGNGAQTQQKKYTPARQNNNIQSKVCFPKRLEHQ